MAYECFDCGEYLGDYGECLDHSKLHKHNKFYNTAIKSIHSVDQLIYIE